MAKTKKKRTRPCVVIIGGGFAGLNAAKALSRSEVDLFLIDRNNFHLFQPLLYQVATAGLEPGDIASPIRAVLARRKNVQVVHGEVTDVDRSEQVVYLENGRIEYDFLIVAAGMENNYFGNDDWRAIAPGLKTLGDALECRRRILRAFERAEWSEDQDLVEALLTFVIVGAGPTGVEMAGAIKEIAHEVMRRDFRNIDPRDTRVILVDAGPAVLSTFHPKTSARAKQDLEEMGIEVRLNAMVDELSADGVQIGDEFIHSHTVLWAAGVKGSPLARCLDAELDRMGRVVVDEHLNIAGDPRVFVVGDLAHARDEAGETLPGLAPVAIQQGRYAARTIAKAIKKGAEYRPFYYRDKGAMATLGRARAVAEIGEQRFGGFLAWLMWLFVHLMFLIGFRNRLFVLLDWFYAYVGSRRSARLILDTPVSVLGESPAERALPPIEVGHRFFDVPAETEREDEYDERLGSEDGNGKAQDRRLH